MKTFPPARPAAAEASPLIFLTVEDAVALRHGLRGIQSVLVRQVGLHDTAGAEVVAFLEAEGLEVSFRQLDHMIPPPLRRFVFRYAGGQAELTVAPGVG
ncbi:MAG: hypothetical protein QM656_13665 [Paracoccaceae bacterium]